MRSQLYSTHYIYFLYTQHLKKQIELADAKIAVNKRRLEDLDLDVQIKNKKLRKLDLEINKLEKEANYFNPIVHIGKTMYLFCVFPQLAWKGQKKEAK